MLLKEFIKLIRVKHYIKNLFIFAPIVFSGKISEVDSIIKALVSFVIFSLLASIIYIINDIFDIEKDRNHPIKKDRPLAKGSIKIYQAIIIIIGFSSIICTYSIVSKNFMVVVMFICYFVINFLYSWFMKNLVLLDVFIIAIGFVLRVMIGSYAIDVMPSTWIIFTTFSISCFLGFGKRRNEMLFIDEHKKTRRVLTSYNKISNIETYINTFLTSTIIFYCLYVSEVNNKIMITIPVVIYGLLRYHLLVNSEECSGDPTNILLGDRGIQITVLTYISLIIFIYTL